MKLNPNGAIASSHAGWVRCFLGRPREAIIDFERVIYVSPLEVTLFRVHAELALAHLLLEEFAEAAAWARRAIEGNPNFTPSYRVLAAAFAHLDRIEEARSVAQRLLELMPDFNVDIEKFVFRRSGGLALYLDGMLARPACRRECDCPLLGRPELRINDAANAPKPPSRQHSKRRRDVLRLRLFG